MKAIILAAGMGSRLGPRAEGRPKALQRIAGKTLVEHQLEALSAEGVGPVVVVVGHGADQVRTVLGDAVEYVVNERPGETNSLYSLWLARDWLDGEVLLLNSDVFFHPDILKRLLATGGSALAYDSSSHGGAEQTKVGLRGRRVCDLGKDFPETGARGENLGLIKLDADGAAALRRRAEAIISAGGERTWVTEAVRSILAEVEVEAVNVAGLPWVEIDFPYDLDRARRQVAPAIRQSMHPHRRAWRRLRRPLGLTGALVSALVAWSLSAQVGPGSIDWESVVPQGADRVRLERAERGSQKWWVLDRGNSVRFDVEGPLPLRLETRPLMPEGVRGEVGYVVELLLDGAPFKYGASHGMRDPDVFLEGYLVGDRDRDKYTMPPGSHVLEVRFLAGEPASILLRVRQPE